MNVTETRAWLAIALAPGLTPGSLETLLAATGSASKLIKAIVAGRGLPGVDAGVDVQLGAGTREALGRPDEGRLDAALAWLDSGPHRALVPYTAGDYPPLLKEISDPPAALFVQGHPAALSALQIAIVGSRNPTPGGRDSARDFADHFAGCGLAITSGLARGVDAAAHRGALTAGGVTVAVCGCGLDRVYPAANADLAREIATTGALVSEFFPGTPPVRGNFPRRNRIISGLALGVLVVEAGLRSGSLITARLAGEQGREIFAIPGSIHNPLSRGCHQLIRQGAKLVESGADVLSELGAIAAASVDAARTPPRASDDDTSTTTDALDPSYQNLLDACGYEPVTVAILVERTGLTAAEVSSMLLILELQGQLESGPGGRYTRIFERS